MIRRMSACLFCKIISGEIPSDKVYEDKYVYAFKDINPQAPFHVLVIPKEHISSAADVTYENSQNVAKCFEAISKITADNGLGDGFRVISNCGKNGGQTVFHLHFHILGGNELGERLI